MSDRIADCLKFNGRLSLIGAWRLQRKLLLVAMVGWGAPIALLLNGAPRAVALAPFSILVVLAVAFAGAHVRRLHDVGRHAHQEIARQLLAVGMTLGPLVAIVVMPRMPAIFSGLLCVIALGSLIFSIARSEPGGPPTWRRGDPEPNAFGPPP